MMALKVLRDTVSSLQNAAIYHNTVNSSDKEQGVMILQRVDKLIEVHLLTQILMLQSLLRMNH